MGLTAKQIYDLNNMNVAAQNISLGTAIDTLQDEMDAVEGDIDTLQSSVSDIEDGSTDTVLSSYAYTELPTPSAGMFVYCTDGNSGSPCLAFASGSTAWLTVTIGSELSGSAA
jgi:hypothetical protein